MAQRPIWRSHLRLALVSCPVALYSAKHDRASIRFNLINPDAPLLAVDGVSTTRSLRCHSPIPATRPL